MIINVTYGNAEGIGRYIQGPAKEHGRDVPGTEDRARIIEGNGFGFPIHTQDDVDLARDVMRRDLELQHSNTKPITNTGIHSSMSWPEGYQPTREEMRQAVDGLAKAWDMEGARRISWSHDDTKHWHVHTLWGAVNPDTGRAYHDHERNDRAQREAIRQEREHGPLPPERQRDHDKAAAAEVSDHARTLDLSKNTDGSITRRRLDRALSLGGHFGPDKTAQRNEFIKQNDLTKFPQHTEQAYAPSEVAREKRDYIRDNREAASNLARAYNREAKERARGVAGLYEDNSFEKTSKPPAREERETNMGSINDALDWPWKKIGVKKFTDKIQDWRDERRYRDVEVQRHNGTTVYPDWMNKREIGRYKDYEKRSADRNRDFGKEVEEKGWDHPEVKREWEKKYGRDRPEREEKREPPSPQQAQGKKTEAELAAEAEEARIKNWQTQRERRDKEEGRTSPKSESPPWRKDEQRSEQWRQQKEQERDEANSVPMPRLNRDPKDQVYRPQQGRETPALPPPREVPMPKIEPEKYVPAWKAARQIDEIAKEKLAKERETLTPEQRKERDALTPEQKQANIDRNIKEFGDEWRRRAKEEREGGALPATNQQEPRSMPEQANPINSPDTQKNIEENWKRDLDKINEELGKEQAEREEQGRELPRSPPPVPNREAGKERAEREERGRELPRSPGPSRRLPEEGRADGTAGNGRRDETQAGQPGILPGGSHEHGSPSQQFRQQLDDSLRKIKFPEREIAKGQERER